MTDWDHSPEERITLESNSARLEDDLADIRRQIKFLRGQVRHAARREGLELRLSELRAVVPEAVAILREMRRRLSKL